MNHIIKFGFNLDNLVMYSWILQSKHQPSSEGLFMESPWSIPLSIRCLAQTDKGLLCLQTQTHLKSILFLGKTKNKTTVTKNNFSALTAASQMSGLDNQVI